jgi:uncharacterized protein YbbC (DUF1343 family)
MNTASTFKPGITTLLEEHADWLDGVKVGLVAHAASTDEKGIHTAQRLHDAIGSNLAALFAPEHGFASRVGAGERIADDRHAGLDIPIHSLYGETRKPTDETLKGLDAIVFDLQDLGIRCYTYCSTLRYVLEAAARNNLRVIVCDRPIPLPNTIDGPMLDTAFTSFVGALPAPLVYGMTPGETARCLFEILNLELDLRVAPMEHWQREYDWPVNLPWSPPSPGIRTWRTAQTYPSTVWCEAFPQLDYGRGTENIFQVVGIPGMKGNEVCDRLNDRDLAGGAFHPHTYTVAAGPLEGHTVTGITLDVTDPNRFRPVETAVHFIYEIQKEAGLDFLWKSADVRPAFFDQLLGTNTVRKGLQSGDQPGQVVAEWIRPPEAFSAARSSALLYPRTPTSTP